VVLDIVVSVDAARGTGLQIDTGYAHLRAIEEARRSDARVRFRQLLPRTGTAKQNGYDTDAGG
jgi:hypothetical protein